MKPIITPRPPRRSRRFILLAGILLLALISILFYVDFSFSILHSSATIIPSREEEIMLQKAYSEMKLDLSEIGTEVITRAEENDKNSSNAENFFVVWNRAFAAAADVAPVADREYTGNELPPGTASDAQFKHHFEYLLENKNPKLYEPLLPQYYFDKTKLLSREDENNKNNDAVKSEKQQEHENESEHRPRHPFVVFVSSERIEFLARLVREVASRGAQDGTKKRQFTLVTGWTDPGPSSYEGSSYLLNSPYVVRWWAQNCDMISSVDPNEGDFNNKKNKMRCLPIGIDWHTVARRPYWGLPKMSAMRQVERMRHLANGESRFFLYRGEAPGRNKNPLPKNSWESRKNEILLDFALGSNTIQRGSLWLNVNFLSPFCMSRWTSSTYRKATRDQIWTNYLNYRFVLSPPGNGYECHRTYEAMILGALPIMQLHPNRKFRKMIADLYQDLPVIFVEDFTCNSINAEKIAEWNKLGAAFWSDQTKIDKMREKLMNGYWIKAIRNY